MLKLTTNYVPYYFRMDIFLFRKPNVIFNKENGVLYLKQSPLVAVL